MNVYLIHLVSMAIVSMMLETILVSVMMDTLEETVMNVSLFLTWPLSTNLSDF